MPDASPDCSVELFIASDGYPLRYRRFDPAGMPKGHVVCIHGIQSHGGWYTHSCDRLRQAGYTVTFLDRRGSGLNVQDRGDTPGFRRLLEDLAEFLRTGVKNTKPFLVCISWGGKLGAALQRYHPGLVAGLALVAPGFCPRIKTRIGDKIRIGWSRLVKPRRYFDIPLNDPELFTAVPRWREFVRDDPLALRQATARFLVESVRLDGYLHVVPKHVTAPVLLLLAGQDRIIDNVATRRFVERFAAKDKEIIEYPSGHHTLEFEPDPEPFINDLIRWLDKHPQ